MKENKGKKTGIDQRKGGDSIVIKNDNWKYILAIYSGRNIKCVQIFTNAFFSLYIWCFNETWGQSGKHWALYSEDIKFLIAWISQMLFNVENQNIQSYK